LPQHQGFKKSTIYGDATTAKVTTTTRCKKATPALEHPATVDGAKDKDTPTLMQLKCPPEVETQQNVTTEVTQTLLQLKDPPVFETWQHGTPDAALTLLRSRRLRRLIRCSMPPHHSYHPSLRTMMTITHV
jgi:hypothetical protein